MQESKHRQSYVGPVSTGAAANGFTRTAIRPYLPMTVAAGALALLMLLLYTMGLHDDRNRALAAPPIAAHAAAPVQDTGTAPAGSLPAVDGPDLCAGVTAMPEAECQALVTFHQRTDGPNWIDNSGWLTVTGSLTPCDWFGVECRVGHVVGLRLPANGLAGALPAAVGDLPLLERLEVPGNLLGGDLPPAVCKLAEQGIQAALDYNRFTPPGARVANCATQIDPDWGATQTAPPSGLELTLPPANTPQGQQVRQGTALALRWNAIPYTGDGGYYQISVRSILSDSFVIHGDTAADGGKSATRYLLDGLEPGQSYQVQVRSYTPAHANQAQELLSAPAQLATVTQAAPEDRILLLVYFPGDNDLAGYIPSVTERIRRGTAVNPNVRVYMLSDGDQDGDSRMVQIQGGQVTPTDAVMARWGSNEVDSADPAVITWFLTEGRTRFPNARTMVSIMGHGLGFAPELAWTPVESPDGEPVEPLPGIPPLPRGQDATPSDITSGSYMSTLDLANALKNATGNGANPFDIVFFDQCFQGNLDLLYELHNTAEIFIASPNYAWLAAPYAAYIAGMAPAADNATLADRIITTYQRSLNGFHPNVIFWLPGSLVPQIAARVNTLADALLAALDDNAASIDLVAERSKYVNTTQCGRRGMELRRPDEMLGADTLARNLQQAFGPGDQWGVHDAADDLLAELAQIRSRVRVGKPYIAPYTFWDYDDTVTLLAPLWRDAPGEVAWRASLYRADTPLDAVWAPDPTYSVTVTAPFAFVRDGRWDEFIRAWYTSTLQPTVGDWCHYTPPTLVVSDTVPLMDLQVTDTFTGGVALDWDETLAGDADAYWIYVQGPETVNFVLEAQLPAGQTFLALGDLASGQVYSYTVAAVDDAGKVIARSQEAGFVSNALFMPLITGDE